MGLALEALDTESQWRGAAKENHQAFCAVHLFAVPLELAPSSGPAFYGRACGLHLWDFTTVLCQSLQRTQVLQDSIGDAE